jgi:hypothetical protein
MSIMPLGGFSGKPQGLEDDGRKVKVKVSSAIAVELSKERRMVALCTERPNFEGAPAQQDRLAWKPAATV